MLQCVAVCCSVLHCIVHSYQFEHGCFWWPQEGKSVISGSWLGKGVLLYPICVSHMCVPYVCHERVVTNFGGLKKVVE